MTVIFLCLYNSLSVHMYLILQTHDCVNSPLFQPFWLTCLVSIITSNHIKNQLLLQHVIAIFYMFISVVPVMTVISYLIHCCPPAVQTLGCVGWDWRALTIHPSLVSDQTKPVLYYLNDIDIFILLKTML